MIINNNIPWVRFGYEMADSQRGTKHWVGYNHLISNKCEWNNCFIKNAHKILRILLDFICKNKRFSACFLFWADVYSYHICKAWYSGSYTMMAKPITALELHYPMIHFLIILISWKIMGRESYAFDIYRESYIFEMLLFRNSSYKFKRIQWNFKVNCIFKSFILHDIWYEVFKCYGSHSFIHSFIVYFVKQVKQGRIQDFF